MTKAEQKKLVDALMAIRAAGCPQDLNAKQRATIQSALDIATKQAPLPAEVQAVAVRLGFKVSQ